MTWTEIEKIILGLLTGSMLLMGCGEKTWPSGTNHIIPLPNGVTERDGFFTFDPEHRIHLTSTEWQSAVDVFLKEFEEMAGWSPEISNDLESEIALRQDDEIHNEGYRLTVSRGQVVVEASTSAGLDYGLQSLLQLFPTDLSKEGWRVPCLSIDDKPRFGWRGFMLDVSRHFFSVEEVKFFLDQMHRLKLNVFHWHLTDDQGWRIESKVYPKLHEVGAWRVDYTDYDWSHNRWWGRPTQQPGDTASYGGYYTHDEIREIVAYARERHINVLPEIDVPGHSQAIIASYPHIACHPGPYHVATGGAFKDNTICPGKEVTYDFMESILQEVMELFPFEYVHIGGDECNKSAWRNDMDCQRLMRQEGLDNEEELQSYFIKRMEQIVRAGGKKMIGWDEILEGGLAPGAAVMSWRGEEGGIAAGQTGHEVIMTPSSRTYLDLKQGHPDHEPNLGYARCLFTDVYNYDPIPSSLSAHADQVLGMQGNLWSESLPTLDMATYMAFPRLFAIAESAWTFPDKKELQSFVPRLQTHMTLMDQKGIVAATSPFDVWIEHIGSRDEVKVNLSTEIKGFEIHFTVDGTEPTLESPIYEEPFALKSTAMVRAAAWQGSKRLGKITHKKLPVHKGTRAKVSIDLPADVPKHKIDRLADHQYGSNWSVDTMWTSFRAPHIEIRMEWTEPIEVSSIAMNFLQMAISGIYMPKNIRISTAFEDLQAKELAAVDLETTARVQGRYIQRVPIEIPPTQVSRLHISLDAVSPIYEGHHLAGSLGRIFLDEIIVN